MVEAYQKFDLDGAKAFERIVVKPPKQVMAQMPDEACFYYIREGKSKTYTSDRLVVNASREGIVMHCGNYFNELIADQTERCEAIAVHVD